MEASSREPAAAGPPAADADEAAPDLRSRRRERTRGEVERVALDLFGARGYDAVTVDDIAAAAGISRRTFFRYFASKEQVLFRDRVERLAAVRRALAARPATEPAATALRAALLSLVDDLVASSDTARRRRAVLRAHPPLAAASFAGYRQWETELVDDVAARLDADPATDVRPGVVVAATLAALRVALRTWEQAPEGDADLHDLLVRALDVVGEGLTAG